MAGDTTTLGKLVVDLLLRDEQFQAGLKNASASMSTSGSAMSSVATKVSGVMTGAFKAMTVAVVAFGAASTVVGAKFEQQMAMVGALQGLRQTDEAFGSLEAQARKLGSTTEFTATQAAQALEELARAGQSVDESITTSNSALVLAGTSASSLADSTQLLVSTQRQFGLAAGDSERITNVFSLAMRKSLLDFSSIREAMKFAGTAGASFGMTLEETTASVAAFRDLGLEGSLAGTNFRMAMIAAAQGTDKQKAALDKYGLTLSDINPETHTFVDIVEKLGEASITAGDAVTIFGSRAGTNVAQLAEQTRIGAIDMRAMTDTLQDASREGNTAADMYETIGQTVAFASKVAMSSLQDLMIEVFGTFAGPLRELIETIPEVLNSATAAVASAAPALRSQFSTALGGISTFLKENAQGLAAAFVNTMKAVASLSPVLLAVAQVLITMATQADLIGLALATAFPVAGALAFVAAIGTIAPAFFAGEVALVAFGTTLTVTTGGLFAAVVAIGSVVTALGFYILQMSGARAETKALQDAQEKLTLAQQEWADAEEKRLGPVLDEQQERIRERLSSTEELTDADRRRLESVLDMTAAEARLALSEGKLIETGGELQDVQALVTRGGEDAAKFILVEADALRESAEATKDRTDKLEKYLATAEADEAVSFTRTAALAESSRLLGQEIETVGELRAVTEAMIASRRAEASQATALRDRVAKGTADAIKSQVQVTFDAEREIARAKGEGADDSESKREQAAKATLRLEEQLWDELARLTKSDAEMRQRSLDQRIADIEVAFASELALVTAGSKEAAEIEERQRKAISTARGLFRKVEAKLDAEAAEKSASDREAIEKRVAQILMQVRSKGVSEAERLEAEKSNVLAKLTEASADQRAEIEADFNKRIAAANQSAERKNNDLILALRGKHLSRREQLQRDKEEVLVRLAHSSGEQQQEALDALDKAYKRDTVAAIGSASKAVAAFGSAAVGAATQAAGAISELLENLTGFSFSLKDTIQSAMDAQADAADDLASSTEGVAQAQERLDDAMASGDAAGIAEAQAGLAEAQAKLRDAEGSLSQGMPGFVQGAVTELITGASSFLAALVEGAPIALNALADQLPVLLEEVVAAIPVLVQALVDGIPPIIMAVVDALPDLLNALIVGLVDVATAVLEQLPALITDLLTVVLPALIATLAEQIPILLQAVVDALPKILTAIVDAIPIVLGAIIEALPVLIESVVSAIPQILTSLLEAIPQIVSAVVGMIPMLITTIVGAIPDILMGFIDNLPDLLTAVISLIPLVVVEIVAAMPAIAMALIEAVIFELLPKLPMIVVELFKAVVEGMGKALKQVAEGIWDAIKGFFNIFKKKDGKGSKTGAFSGMNYVPATMRMTVHKGEAIVPADRNPAAGGGGVAGPAPAGFGANFGGEGGGGGGAPIDIAIMAEGRLLDAVQVQAMRRGGAVGMQREIRRSSGVRVGLDRGRFTPWSK